MPYKIRCLNMYFPIHLVKREKTLSARKVIYFTDTYSGVPSFSSVSLATIELRSLWELWKYSILCYSSWALFFVIQCSIEANWFTQENTPAHSGNTSCTQVILKYVFWKVIRTRNFGRWTGSPIQQKQKAAPYTNATLPTDTPSSASGQSTLHVCV